MDNSDRFEDISFSNGDNFTHSNRKGKTFYYEHFTLSYSEEDEQSEWVAYELTREESYGKIQRKELFTEDPNIPTESAKPYQYRDSRFTKGHLAPAGDMKFDSKAMEECFYMSNVSPQEREFNAGVWNDLEQQVRQWARKFGKVYVITGPFLPKKVKKESKLSYVEYDGDTIKSDITIPKFFFKVIFDYTYKGKEKMIAFIMPNEKIDNPDKKNGGYDYLFDYATTVDDVEAQTGLDFFTNLPKDERKRYESTLDIKAWKKFMKK
jgi:endonuclease G